MPRLPTFVTRVSDWETDLLEQNYPLTTASKYKEVALFAWNEWGSKHDWPMDPKKLEAKHVREYMDWLMQWSTATQSLRTIVLLLYIRWCGNKNLDRFKVKIKVQREHVDWLEDTAQVSLVLNTAPSSQALALESLYIYTGIRRSEALKLRLADVTEQTLLVRRGKGGKGRTIPLTPQFWQAIKPYVEWRRMQPGEMFLLYTKEQSPARPYSYSGLGRLLESHMAMMEFHFSAHTFRRTFGRQLYFAGMPLPEIQYLYGHASMDMTIRYLGIRESDARTSLEKYQPRYI